MLVVVVPHGVEEVVMAEPVERSIEIILLPREKELVSIIIHDNNSHLHRLSSINSNNNTRDDTRSRGRITGNHRLRLDQYVWLITGEQLPVLVRCR